MNKNSFDYHARNFHVFSEGKYGLALPVLSTNLVFFCLEKFSFSKRKELIETKKLSVNNQMKLSGTKIVGAQE